MHVLGHVLSYRKEIWSLLPNEESHFAFRRNTSLNKTWLLFLTVVKLVKILQESHLLLWVVGLRLWRIVFPCRVVSFCLAGNVICSAQISYCAKNWSTDTKSKFRGVLYEHMCAYTMYCRYKKSLQIRWHLEPKLQKKV